MLKCDCGVERLFIDRVNKLLDASRERENETKKTENSWWRQRKM